MILDDSHRFLPPSTVTMVYTLLVTLLTLTTGGLCVPDRYFYFVDYSFSKVYRIDPNEPQRHSVPVSRVQNPTAVGYDEYNEQVYVASGHLNSYNTTKYIHKYHFNSGGTQQLELLRSSRVTTVAVDSGSSLLYYADLTEKVIVAVTTDFRYEATIIDTDLDQPSDIALDIGNRVMYWCDASQTFPIIGKANMDGTLRMNIVTHGLYAPYAITLDVPNNKIYWVDQSTNTIDRCNTDGTGREPVPIVSLGRMNPPVISVAVDEIYVYWVQRLRGAIFKKRKNGVQSIERIGTEYSINTTDYRSLRLVHTSPPSPQGTNACSGRGGCQHICIPTSQSRVCRCSEGHILQPDGTSCQEASFTRGVVTVDINTRVLIVLDLDTNITRKLKDTWYSDPRGIALDETTFEIFWTDRSRRAIFQTCIPTPCFKVVKTYTELESDLGDVALDTQRKNIYVGDSGLGRISKISYSGNQEEVIISDGFEISDVIVVQIALDTNTRKIYWATGRTIKVANMDDGSAQKQLQTGLNIGGLVLDTKNQRLYVLRHDLNDIVAMDLTRGNSLQLVHHENGARSLAGLVLGDGMLYFGDRKDGSINEFNVATQEVKKYGQKNFRTTFSIVYFNRNPQTQPGTVTGATPEGTMATASSGGGLLNQTLVIALSVSFGGLILIVGIIICGFVIYKRILTTVTPATIPPAVNLPPSQPPSKVPKQVPVTKSSGEYSELREFPGIPNLRPPPPLPTQAYPNQVINGIDSSYVIPIASPSMRGDAYINMSKN